jgi:hypothetical protein
MGKSLQRYGVEKQMKVKLEKAGSNSQQPKTSQIIGGKNDRFMAKVGDKIHIQGQPKDVVWTVVSIVGES